MKDVNILTNNGVNVAQSLELFGDMEMYDETLKDFLDMVDGKLSSLENRKASSDMVNYAIEVHALKSDARYLGFTTLADLAYESELKSKAGDIMFVQENHPKIMAEAKKMVDIAKQYLGLAPVQSVVAAPAAQPTEQVQPQPAPVEQPVEAAPTPVEQPAAPVAPVEPQVVAQPQPVAPVAPQPVQDPMAQAIVNQGMAPEAQPQPVVPAPVTQPVSAPAMPVQQEVPPVAPASVEQSAAPVAPVQSVVAAPAVQPTEQVQSQPAPVEPQVVAQPQPVAPVVPQSVAPQPQVVQQAPVAAPVETPAQPTVQFFPADNQPAQPTVQFFPAGNQAQQPVAQPGMAPAADGQKQGTILIVDDSNLVVNFVKKIFDSRYNVIIASDGAKAIELLDQEDVRKDIKACLLDLNMPNVDGYAVLEHCKQKGYFVRMPVAVESGVEDMASIDRVNAYPIVDILSKPFNERDVQRVIEKCLATYF